jgi:hypothetical protein
MAHLFPLSKKHELAQCIVQWTLCVPTSLCGFWKAKEASKGSQS